MLLKHSQWTVKQRMSTIGVESVQVQKISNTLQPLDLTTDGSVKKMAKRVSVSITLHAFQKV